MMRVKASRQFGCFEGLTFDHPNSPEQCSGGSGEVQGRVTAALYLIEKYIEVETWKPLLWAL